MAERRQLPPQIKRVELAQRDGGRPVVRYQLTVDVGDVDGKRKQLRKRYATEEEARAALDTIRGEVPRGTYVHPIKVTLAEACQNWLAAKHGLKPSTLHGHRVNLAAAVAELGEVEVQKPTKRHLDDLANRFALPVTSACDKSTWKNSSPWSNATAASRTVDRLKPKSGSSGGVFGVLGLRASSSACCARIAATRAFSFR